MDEFDSLVNLMVHKSQFSASTTNMSHRKIEVGIIGIRVKCKETYTKKGVMHTLEGVREYRLPPTTPTREMVYGEDINMSSPIVGERRTWLLESKRGG